MVGEGGGTENIRELETEEVLYIFHPSAGISEQEMAQFMADPYFLVGKSALFFRKRGEERGALTFRSSPIVSEEVSQEAVTHSRLCLPTANNWGDRPGKPVESHTGNTQRVGAYGIEVSRVEFEASADGQVGVPLMPGGYGGGTRPVEWKSGRNPRVTRGTAKLKCYVFLPPRRVAVPPMRVCRWRPYPSGQTCGCGRSGPLPRCSYVKT